LEALKQARVGEKIRINKYSATRSPSISGNAEQINDDRQAHTTNILVSVLLKRFSPAKKRPQIYEKSKRNEFDHSSYNFDQPDLPLRTYIREQLDEANWAPTLKEIEAEYDSYSPIFVSDDTQSGDPTKSDEIELARQKAFVDKLRNTLYPQSGYFRISTSDNVLSLELLSRPDSSADKTISYPNLIDVFATLESDRAYYFMAPFRGTTLQDLLKYSSGVLNSNVKKSFIAYQLLRGVKSLHQQGVVHGGLKLSNILVDENLWIKLTGFECAAPLNSTGRTGKDHQSLSTRIPRALSDESLTMKWVRGEISNFSYIMALNHFAGRSSYWRSQFPSHFTLDYGFYWTHTFSELA